MSHEQEEEQEQLDDHTDVLTHEEDLSDDDHHRSQSPRRKTSTSTQAMGNKRGADAVGTGENNPHQNERFKSATSSTKKDFLANGSPMIATTTESKQEGGAGDKDKNKNHGQVAEQRTADAGGEANHPRIPNATDLTSQICDDDEEDSEDDEHNVYHSNDKAEEDANVSFVLQRTTKKHSRKDASSTTFFPQYLMNVIELESQHDQQPNILDWVEVNGGDAFLIRDKEAFERNIVPKYFSRGVTKCKFMSFVRKLYRYVPFPPTLMCKNTFTLCCVFCSYHHLIPVITLGGVSVKFLSSHRPAAMVQV